MNNNHQEETSEVDSQPNAKNDDVEAGDQWRRNVSRQQVPLLSQHVEGGDRWGVTRRGMSRQQIEESLIDAAIVQTLLFRDNTGIVVVTGDAPE